jgi:hypothetical protein
VNARILQTLTISLLAISLTGCASFSFGPKVKPIEVVAKPMEKTPLDIPLPDPLKIKPIEWMLITPANQEEVFSKLEQQGDDLVLIGLTDDGYQQLAITIAELRNLINLQRNIIIKYKEYYEPKKEATVEKK